LQCNVSMLPFSSTLVFDAAARNIPPSATADIVP
jgi:hypothetical protein